MMIPLTITTPVCQGRALEKSFVTKDDAMYHCTYECTRRVAEGYIAVLSTVVEIMPPAPPQICRYTEDTRLPMMENGAFSLRLEAEQRRKEWKEWMGSLERSQAAARA